ncbi:hypothetical protein ABN034_29225 [Actinopolymorpha sp. B11F2]|uniref:hypothetical protein n=1 Tax=Actinopolymorpha sp. B11F2 TaxID=3160862 RepID=UPI0032E41201
MRLLCVLACAMATSGCFPQSGAMAENCESLRSVWYKAQADMRAVVHDDHVDPQDKSRRLTAIADQLRQESQSIKDEQLRTAMNGVASDFRIMADALGGVGSRRPAVSPLPPITNIQKLNKAIDQRCPA